MSTGSGESTASHSQPQDLPSKYEKLASEYAKIKAQAIVLKKAVVDEQKQNGELKQTLRTQEQSLRKNEQEMESLVFRNQQLTKRVTVLQDDLEEEKKVGKKGGKKTDSAASSAQDNNGVLDEDFKRLVKENAKLHTLFQDKEDAHSAQLVVLNEQIDKLRRDLRDSQRACRTADEKYEPVIAKLKRERDEQDAKLRSLESVADSLKSLQKKFSTLEANYKQLEYFASNLSKHFSVDNLSGMTLNNVSLSDSSEQYLHKCIVDIITALTSFFGQLNNRLSYLSDVALQNKFSRIQNLCESGKAIIQKFISKNSLDSMSIVEYRNHLDALLDNVKSVHKCQSNLPSNLIDFISHLIRIFNVLPQLFVDKTKIYISSNALSKVICEVVIFEQLAKMLGSIFQNETQLELKSNLRNMEELTSVNDCFLESLGTLENCVQTLGNVLTQLLLGLNQPAENQEVHSTIVEFSKKAGAQLALSHTCDSYENKTNTHAQFLVQTAELDSLRSVYSQQIRELQSSLEKIEKEKLSWQSQYEVLSMKTSRAERSQSTTEFADNARRATDAADGSRTAELSTEEKIVEYYRRKLNELVEEKQKAEGKATLVSSECVALHKRLEYLIDSEHELQELMVKWKQYAAQLKDELRSTTQNYETQLSVMSEHLVELNLDLNEKRDAIETLNLQLSNKGTKSKSKS